MAKQDPYTEIFNQFAGELIKPGDNAEEVTEKVKQLHLAWNKAVADFHSLPASKILEEEIAAAAGSDSAFSPAFEKLYHIKNTRFPEYNNYIISIQAAAPASTVLLVESVDPLKLAKLGTLAKPAMMNVHTEEQALDILAYCSSRGWQVIVEVHPEEPENMYPLFYLQAGIVPTEKGS
ncbi:MAG: hypothetical protein EOO04_04665 [Chitinophagaceae bacterium]|nr:MAG: hypothetical protein EOO04_04665 [Chitinophagaceae bacterium]